jgi:RNA processing factor Prp31
VALATSTSKKTIDASGYIDDIKNELNRLKDHVEEDNFPDLKKLKRKEDYVDALIKV